MNSDAPMPWLQSYTPWTDPHLDYDGVTIRSLFLRTATEHGDQPATQFFGSKMTWSEVHHEARRVAAGLLALGVGPGDRVAIMLPNCPQHFLAFFAAQLIGAVVVEHNPLYTAAELRPQFADHGAKVAIVWDKTAKTLQTLRDDTALETIISVDMTKAMPLLPRLALRLPLAKVRAARAQITAPAPGTTPWEEFVPSSDSSDAEARIDSTSLTPDSPGVILYTSGTTGRPKGAVLSQRNLCANAIQGIAWVKEFQAPGQRMLATLPFFHGFGLTFSLTLPAAMGGEVVLLPAPELGLIMRSIKKYKPTFIPGVPTVFERIIARAKEDNVDLSSVAIAFSGAASLPSEVVSEWEGLTGGRLIEGYGLTETSPILAGNPESDDRRPGHIGVPFPDTVIRIVDPDNPDQDRAFGEAGELIARGPQVFGGYLHNDEATAKAFHDGWFRTGDMGEMDEKGFIRIVSRIKELIITGGFNVYPAEVEDVLRRHEDIEDVAVVGRPREDGSEDVVACVTLAKGATLDEKKLRDFARENLTRYKVPRTIYEFDELARDPMGKIRRREVRTTLLDRISG